MSKGTPTTAMSAEPTSSSRGSRAKVAGPAKRGMREESTGPRGSGRGVEADAVMGAGVLPWAPVGGGCG